MLLMVLCFHALAESLWAQSMKKRCKVILPSRLIDTTHTINNNSLNRIGTDLLACYQKLSSLFSSLFFSNNDRRN